MTNKDQYNEEKTEYNVFRDSPLRYMGYANEIGESFRYQVSCKELRCTNSHTFFRHHINII